MNINCKEKRHVCTKKICLKCGADFCYACCKWQNVDQGGKHDLDSMLCPKCGHDYYRELTKKEKPKQNFLEKLKETQDNIACQAMLLRR